MKREKILEKVKVENFVNFMKEFTDLRSPEKPTKWIQRKSYTGTL